MDLAPQQKRFRSVVRKMARCGSEADENRGESAPIPVHKRLLPRESRSRRDSGCPATSRGGVLQGCPSRGRRSRFAGKERRSTTLYRGDRSSEFAVRCEVMSAVLPGCIPCGRVAQSPRSAGGITGIVSFGDSLTDTGNLYAATGQPEPSITRAVSRMARSGSNTSPISWGWRRPLPPAGGAIMLGREPRRAMAWPETVFQIRASKLAPTWHPIVQARPNSSRFGRAQRLPSLRPDRSLDTRG